ncbi:MAG: glutaredoxin domain-containing protein [Bacteroidota bacterium]
MKKILTLLFLVVYVQAYTQEKPIKVITKDIPNRLAFYAVNETEKDYDVQIIIKGTNFRQSSARPRLIRVPGASEVHLKTIILTRGKKPSYTYDLTVNDSLSRRALRKEFKRVKIKPKKHITVYVTDKCAHCDSIIQPLNESNYIFRLYTLNENPEIKSQLKRSFSQPLDSIEAPIVNVGGRLFTTITNYDRLLEELNKEE